MSAASSSPESLRLAADFSASLLATWRKSGRRPRMGLAISGGVDSMAMASLCSNVARGREFCPSFMAFIVDHKLRPESTQEANDVAHELRRTNIQPEILTLNWAANGINPTSTPHLEHAARRLRYQAIGTACRESNINTLLVAHHTDDQAETVLMRLVGGYHGSGLSGIKAEKPIPECEGVYGVHASGTPRSAHNLNGSNVDTVASERILIEEGGVTVHRPLSRATKSELISYCRHAGVRWFEDKTNSDPQFALRNTIRHMLHHDLLPTSLRKHRLLELATTITRREQDEDLLAQQEVASMPLTLDLTSGRLVLEEYRRSLLTALPSGNSIKTRATALRRLLLLVAPTETIPLRDVHTALQKLATDTKPSVHVAGVDLVCSGGRDALIMQRQVPNARELKACVRELLPKIDSSDRHQFIQSEWQLWDCRYWLRVSCKSELEGQVIAFFLTPDGLGRLRESLSGAEKIRLEQALRFAPSRMRYTLPVLSLRNRGRDQDNPVGSEIFALPTLGWSTGGWCRWPVDDTMRAEQNCVGYWDVRYRKVDFEVTDHHKILSDFPGGDHGSPKEPGARLDNMV